MDDYLNPDSKWNEQKLLLFEYCDENEHAPSHSIIYKDQNIGTWLNVTQKRNVKSIDDDLYKKLSENTHVKKCLDEYLSNVAKNMNKKKLTWDQWHTLLFEYCNENEHVPQNKTMYKGHNIGAWLQNQKINIKNINDDIYVKLSQNIHVKKSLDDYLNPDGKLNEQIRLLFKYCDENKCTPPSKQKFEGCNIGMWFQDQKKKVDKKDDDLYKKLSINEYVKQSLDDYINPNNKWNDRKQLLFKYCDENKCIPSAKQRYDGIGIGQWFHHQKSNIKNINDDIYVKLSENEYVKKSLDDYLNPDNKWNERKQLLFEYCNENACTPSNKTIYKGLGIGQWFQDQKKKMDTVDDDLYKKLSTNEYVKKNLDKYFMIVEKNKDKEKLNWDDWKKLLFEYCNENEHVPQNKTMYKGHNIGAWLQNQKININSINDNKYIKLSNNEYVRKNLDEYLIKVEINKGKLKLSWEQWLQLLFEYCNDNECYPQRETEYKGQNIGCWLSNQKHKIKSIDDDLYKKLSVNEYVKKSLDNYLNPDNERTEWMILLFEYCEENKCCPKTTTIYKGQHIGKWLSHQKEKIKSNDDNLYIRLTENQYVKKNLDEYLMNVEKNKNKEKLNWEQTRQLLFNYCDENGHHPSYSINYKGQNIGAWLCNTQIRNIKSINDDSYKKLSENTHVKKYLDTHLKSKKILKPKDDIHESTSNFEQSESDESEEVEKVVRITKKQPIKKPPVRSDKVVIRKVVQQ